MRKAFKEENVRRMIRRAGIEMHAHGKADLISAVRSLLDHLSFELLKKSVIIAEGSSRKTLTELDLTQALASVHAGPTLARGIRLCGHAKHFVRSSKNAKANAQRRRKWSMKARWGTIVSICQSVV